MESSETLISSQSANSIMLANSTSGIVGQVNIPSIASLVAPMTVPINSQNTQSSQSVPEKPKTGDDVMVSKINVDNDASFFATFVDGSSFRNMIEYLRLPNIEGVFRFTKQKILYEQGDSDNNILNVVELSTYELTEYSFSSKTDEVVVGISLADLRNITRNVGKKDHIDLYKLSSEPKNLYIQIRSQSEKGSESNLYLLPITCTSYTMYRMPDYVRGKKDPTCTVYQSDFSKLCKSLNTIKCSHAVVHGFTKGMIFKGFLNTGVIGSVKEFGKCNNTPTQANLKSIVPHGGTNIIKSKIAPPRLNIGEIGEIERFKIDINILKYLIKLNALCPSGTLKCYIEKGLPLLLVTNIGTFGRISVFLMG